MTKLSRDEVRAVAKLARLRIAEADLEKMAKELTAILGYVEMLNEADTASVEPTAQVTGLVNVFRDDIVAQGSIPSHDSLLASSPLQIVEHQIRFPHAHG